LSDRKEAKRREGVQRRFYRQDAYLPSVRQTCTTSTVMEVEDFFDVLFHGND
jgi:hypothetical protein